ncbi:MAG: CvpA family protein [Succinivibrio sp.]|nr:CvpA family protein [Succinivibrio sp.]
MTLTPLDWIILGIIGLSSLFSIIRGFVKEAASIVAWLSAFVVAGRFYSVGAQYLTFSDDALTRNVISAIVLFVVTLMIVGAIGSMIAKGIQKAGLSGFDRILGIAFGVARGVLIVAACVAVVQILFKLNLFNFIQNFDWWKNSLFIPELQRLVSWFFVYLGTTPENIAGV